MRSFFTILSLLLLFTFTNAFSQTGKVSGYIKDATTGEALFGVNVVVEGTKMGAATNIDGFYNILNLPPGTYTVKATMVGFAPQALTGLRVNINQTTEANFSLTDQSLTTDEIVVIAEAPVVQKDVSASTVNLSAEDVKNMPIVSVSSVVNLQAGVQGGAIRGGGGDQTAWMLNGVTLRDERTNAPYTGVSMTSVEEVQILTGGFQAEYGDIRSGVVNVVTKEGKNDRFNISLIGRYRPTGPKHFGASINDPNSYWMRPYVDDNVAWTGTLNPMDTTNWNTNTRAQYPEFAGWNAISQAYLTDGNPNTPALSPRALQKLYLFQHRKNNDIAKADYDIDGSIGGYFPGVSKYLGNLRFLASFRGTREMYLLPLSEDAYEDNNFQLRLTSDIAPGMKLSLEGLVGNQSGTTSSSTGSAGIWRGSSDIAEALSKLDPAKNNEHRIYTYDYWAPTKVNRNNISARLTHVLNPTTFYDVILSRFESEYETNPGRLRDTSRVFSFGNGYLVDEGPYGYWEEPTTGVETFRMSVGFSNSRDSSIVRTYNAKFDITSQLDKYNNIKAGVEFRYSENLANYAYIDKYLPSGKYLTRWSAYPIRGAFYVQDKLEFEGMIANLGVRFDYSDPNVDWYKNSIYDPALSGSKSLGIDTLVVKEPAESRLTISPRLGVAFPITETSKLYFNYGHFRQLPTPEQLYLLRRYLDNNQVVFVANPNNELPRTIAYELGYEQSVFDEYLVKIAGYYKDVSLQTTSVTYVSRNGAVNYSTSTNNSYADIRGFELELRKNRGDWVRGFLNYTYMVSTSGRFGFATYNESSVAQRNYENLTNATRESKPLPRPYGRINLDFFTPNDWDPLEAGLENLFSEWTLNVLGSWSSGMYFSWTGGGSIPGISNNVQWNDYFDVDLRVSKNLKFGPVNLQFFVDINNVFNIKYLSYDYGYSDSKDFDAYMKSLHLTRENFENFGKDANGDPRPGYFNDKDNSKFVFGDDKPGDYRVGPYIPWDENASDAQKEEWKKNKSYIDMPNLTSFTFLNVRDYYFGIRLNLEL